MIIPVYNGERFILDTIATVQAQTYRDFELIVVDDGSTDGTLALVRRQAMGKVLTRLNGGPAAARNTGLAEAQGEYLAFLDADDLWHPEWLAHTVAALDADPALDVVYTDGVVLDRAGKLLRTIRSGPPGNTVARLLMGGFVLLSRTLLRRSAGEAVGGFGDLRLSEDWDFFIRLALAGRRFAHLELPLVARREYGGNLTSRAAELLACSRHVLAEAYAQPLAAGVPPYRLALARCLMFASWSSVRPGGRLQAVRYFLQGLALHPRSLATVEARAALAHLLLGDRGFAALQRSLTLRHAKTARQWWGSRSVSLA
ncbi:MAG: glycosyltransferase [Deinococcus sp.]|nr:glycosyltransferase [Deinococcus sp.]